MDVTDAQIRRLADAGTSVALIARQLGVSRYRVATTLEVAPVGRNDVPYRLRALEADIVDRYRRGQSGEAIARALEISTTAVYATLRRSGVALRGKTHAHELTYEEVLTTEYLTAAIIDARLAPAEVAAQIGCSESTVRNWMRRRGIAPAPRPRRLTYNFSDELLDQIADGTRTLEEAAAHVGCSRDEVRRALRRSGRTLPTDRRPPLTADLLRDLYMERGMTTVAIAEATGWHFNAVRAALRRHQIPRRIGRPPTSHVAPGVPPAVRQDRRS